MKNKLRIVLYKKEKPATILTDFLPLVFLYSTAQNETRTHTPLPELGPEPSASTKFRHDSISGIRESDPLFRLGKPS